MSRVINGFATTHRISPATQKRVLDAAAALNYRPNVFARADLVTYRVTDEAPIKAIAAIALQSGVPVGIAFGQDQQLLCRSRRSFDIRDKAPSDALAEVSGSVDEITPMFLL